MDRTRGVLTSGRIVERAAPVIAAGGPSHSTQPVRWPVAVGIEKGGALPASTDALIRQRITLPHHYPEPVIVETLCRFGDAYEIRVRRSEGTLDETTLSGAELEDLLGRVTGAVARSLADPHLLRLLVESARICLAYSHDRQFAVSLSGIRTLPHQVEAVYERMLPQPRLCFMLADDPGAGRAIMTVLYIEEMKLRQATCSLSPPFLLCFLLRGGVIQGVREHTFLSAACRSSRWLN